MIDKRAVIDDSARLAPDVSVGPYAIIAADVHIDAGTRIESHVVIKGPSRIGKDNHIFQFASLGDMPQDRKYSGEATWMEMGDRNIVREYCTVNRGTMHGGGRTVIGDDNLFMAYAHVAHDCHIGNHTVFSNCASLGGHVAVGDHAILSGFAIVHQFCRIGAHSFLGMGSAVARDVPPFVTVTGQPARPRGINAEGLKRRDFGADTISHLRRAYKVLFRSRLSLDDAISRLQDLAAECEEVDMLVKFLQQSERSLVR